MSVVSDYRIVRRAYGKYTTITTFTGTWGDAQLRSMTLESINRDGEYFVRGKNEPDYMPGQSYQSGMDWL